MSDYSFRSNRTPLDGTLLFGFTPKDCMSVWAAARCTTAASPYFKPLVWNGQILFNGGFALHCPSDSAYSEAKHIWPGKHCDILLSLGTGTTLNQSFSDLRRPSSAGVAAADHTADARSAWAEFESRNRHSHRQNLVRLDPIYHGTEFSLDDVKKLKDIRKQTEEWILTQDNEVNNICDRLIAALFFFRPSSEIYDGLQVGEIFCRLPSEEGRKLAIGMLRKVDFPLFAVKYNGETLPEVNAREAFRDFCSTGELRLEVTRRLAIPTTGDIEIDVEIRYLCGSAKFPWLPISGSPYIIREKQGFFALS